MIAQIVVGVAAAAATVGGVWLALPKPGEASSEPLLAATTYVDLPTIAAPLFEDDRVSGYVLLRFGFEAREHALKELSVPPKALITDALHDLAFEGRLDPLAEGFDAETLRERIMERLDERLAGVIVKAMVLQVDLLAKEEIRSNAVRRRVRAIKQNAGPGEG